MLQTSASSSQQAYTDTAPRADRAQFIGFVNDLESEHAVRGGMETLFSEAIDLRRGNIQTATTVLEQIPSPQVILVDISGVDDPIRALVDLSSVVEPDVKVLVIGTRQDINFYRQITRNLGVVEYLFKPLTMELIARRFSIILDPARRRAPLLGGRLVTVTGASGGAGATTVAANLGWYLASIAHRYTLLIDTNLQFGTMPTLLGVQNASGLKTILEATHRVDDLFISRAAIQIEDRFYLLADEEPFSPDFVYSKDALTTVLRLIERRYNHIVADTPLNLTPLENDLLERAHQRIVVFEPTVMSLKNTLRFLSLPKGENQVLRPLLVLNRLGQPGGLSLEQVKTALGASPDVTLPYMPKTVNSAANLGEFAASGNSVYRRGIAEIAHEVGAVSKNTQSMQNQISRMLQKLRERLT